MPQVRFPVLLVTESGKTVKIDNVVETVQRPTHVLASNETLEFSGPPVRRDRPYPVGALRDLASKAGGVLR